MEIKIIGAESLGVRGLCCFVAVGDPQILIAPGIALGFLRNGRAPHPIQVAVDEVIREKIIQAWELATDIVFSHFHGDHVPLVDANPYQLDAARVAGLNPGVRIWTKSPDFLSAKEKERSTALKQRLPAEWREGAPGMGPLRFSMPVPHGEKTARNESVMMTRIADDAVFVHTSDIQLLDDDTVAFHKIVCTILFGFNDTMADNLAPQRVFIDVQFNGCFDLFPLIALQGLYDGGFLIILQGQGGIRCNRRCSRPDAGRQMGGIDEVAAAHHKGVFQGIFELTDITGPVV